MKINHWRSFIAAASVICLATPGKAEEAKAPAAWPGIVTSVSSSATLSTEGMSPGGEIWAGWYMLPPGKAVEIPAMPPNLGKFAWLGMALKGSAFETTDPVPMCRFVRAGGVEDPSVTEGREATWSTGDMEACNYAILPATRDENRGTQPFIRAEIVVGGPWVYGMPSSPDEYAKANGVAQVLQIDKWKFGTVERELLRAGAMTVTIRRVTMPPGARLVAADRYPTLRMIEIGQVTWGILAAGSDAATAPKDTFKVNWPERIGWTEFPEEGQVVLFNADKEPAEFIEWSVTPAPNAKP